jgi:proline utilization trans-activator
MFPSQIPPQFQLNLEPLIKPDPAKEAKDKATSRVSVACERCRKRHKKCNGGSPCDNCAKSRAECTYIESERKIVVTLKYIQTLQNENSDLKAELKSLKKTANVTKRNIKLEEYEEHEDIIKRPRLSKSSSSHSLKSNDIDTESVYNSTKLDKDIVRKSSLVAGSTSMTEFGDEINQIFPTANVSFKELDEQTENMRPTLVYMLRNEDQFIVQSRQPDQNPINVELDLPPYQLALKYYAAFNVFLGECFYFFNDGRLKTELYNIYFNYTSEYQLSRERILKVTSILMILAIGKMYYVGQNTTTPSPFFPGMEYFNTATFVINFAHTSLQTGICSVDNVQALLLYAFYHQIVDAASGHFLLAGLAMRGALVIGMHNDTGKETMNRYELEHRRRLWWTLYAIDRYCSAKFGFPLSIPDEAITTELPSNIQGNILRDNNTKFDVFPDPTNIIQFIRISQIFSSMMVRIYQQKIHSDIVPIILSVLSELYQWRKSLPDALKVDYTKETIETSRNVVNIHSEYFRCINLTIRPLLLYFVRKRLRSIRVKRAPIDLTRYSTDIMTLLNASLRASIQTIRSHNHLLSMSLLAKFGYLDREYIYSAISTLILFNVAFGVHGSASQQINVGLSLLSDMARVGNKNAARRKEQTLHLISTFEKNGIPSHHFPPPSSNNQPTTTSSLASLNRIYSAPPSKKPIERLPSISQSPNNNPKPELPSSSSRSIHNLPPPPSVRRPSESSINNFDKKAEMVTKKESVGGFNSKGNEQPVSLPSISRLQQQTPEYIAQYDNVSLPPPSPQGTGVNSTQSLTHSPQNDNFSNYNISNASKANSSPQQSQREVSPASDATSGSANTPERYTQNFMLLNQNGPDMFDFTIRNFNTFFRHTSNSLGLPENFFDHNAQENLIQPEILETYSLEFLDLLNGTSNSVNGGPFTYDRDGTGLVPPSIPMPAHLQQCNHQFHEQQHQLTQQQQPPPPPPPQQQQPQQQQQQQHHSLHGQIDPQISPEQHFQLPPPPDPAWNTQHQPQTFWANQVVQGQVPDVISNSMPGPSPKPNH